MEEQANTKGGANIPAKDDVVTNMNTSLLRLKVLILHHKHDTRNSCLDISRKYHTIQFGEIVLTKLLRTLRV